jgi:hypothetical protein
VAAVVEGVASGVREGSRNAAGEVPAEEGVKELRPGRERLGADSWRLMGGGAKGCCWMEQAQREQIRGYWRRGERENETRRGRRAGSSGDARSASAADKGGRLWSVDASVEGSRGKETGAIETLWVCGERVERVERGGRRRGR